MITTGELYKLSLKLKSSTTFYELNSKPVKRGSNASTALIYSSIDGLLVFNELAILTIG